MKRPYVDSRYVSRSTGDKVCVRTFLAAPRARYSRDSYVIIVNGRRAVETQAKAVVRNYIVQYDCTPVEKF